MIRFFEIVNQKDAKLALLLNLIEPRCGGVLLLGPKGVGKSTLIRAFREILNDLGIPNAELPLNATEEAVLGGIGIEEALKRGERIFQEGLVKKAHGGFLFVENINLLSNEILSLIFEVQSRKENIVEREGISVKEPADFQIIGTMDPEEAELSFHFLDRFGMSVTMDKIVDKNQRMEVLKLNIFSGPPPRPEDGILSTIKELRKHVKKVNVSEKIMELIGEITLKECIFSHRADISLYYGAKALASFLGEDEVKEDHVRAVAPFILFHRRRIIEQEKKDLEIKWEQKNSDSGDSGKATKKERNINIPNLKDLPSSFSTLAKAKEEVFPIGNVFKVRKLLVRKDRIVRNVRGRRTRTRTKGKGGRYVRSVLKKTDEIAFDATIRAAAPYQIVRKWKDTLIIFDEDLRYKEKERKMSHITIFLVDGSGSMGVEKRMLAVKGAILSLLYDCYQKRDKVAMILFRKDRAEIVLPPTSSFDFAQKRLREIPTGGKTPLAHGLIEAHKLIKRLSFKNRETRFLVFLLTDGKANVSVSGRPVWDEIKDICFGLQSFPFADFIVLDTEKKESFMKMDAALKIATFLGAKYYLLEDITSHSLLDLTFFYKRIQESSFHFW